MKKNTSLRWTVLGLSLGVAPCFSQIPDSIWHTNDTGYFHMWNRRDLNTDFWARSNNWSVVNPTGILDSAIIRTDGLTRSPSDPGWSNLVWKWQSTTANPNFEIRFSWHMTSSPSGNSGFNARGHCGSGSVATFCGGASQGYRVFGPQIDLGPTYTGDVWNSGASRYATAVAGCKLGTATTWQDLGYRLEGDSVKMLYYNNGFAAGNPIVCSRYLFTVADDRWATSPGLFALQYETLEISEFKNIKIRNLSAVPTAIKSAEKSRLLSTVAGGRGSVEFSIPTSGHYSVQISDVKGVAVKTFQGTGPVSHQNVALGRAGIFFVQVSSVHGTVTKKVLAY